MKIEQLPLSEIRTDGGTQMRVVPLDNAAVSEYAEAMSTGAEFPPMDVFRDKKGALWLANGHHRYHAYVASLFKENKDLTVPCFVHDGELEDAQAFALKCNVGLRFTNADKRNAVLFVLNHKKWRERSSRWIGEMCGVSQQFVSNVIEEAAANGWQLSEYVIAKDGKKYPRESPAKQAVSPPPAPKESTMTLPATSEQIRTLSDAFMEMEDDAVDTWLEPYGVEDWDELNRDQADELIRDIQAADSADPPEDWLPPPAADSAAVASRSESSVDGDVEYCQVDGRRLRLTGDLAERWRQIRVAHEDIKTAERRTRNAVKTLASLSAGFRRARDLERGPNQRWRKKSLEIEFTGLKEDAPHAPCPNCFATPRKGCIFCSESQFVSKRDWRGMVMDSEKNVLFRAMEEKA